MNTDPNIKIIKHIYQLKRGEQDAVEEKNPTPLSGEPIVIFGNDGETRLKIGDGETPVNDCNIIGENAGQFADKTNSDEIFRVGNGTSDENRSNAFVVHEDGRATVQSEPEEDNDVVTKKYVDDNAGETQAEIDELKANKADKDKVIDLLTYQIRYDSTTGTTVRITGIKQGAVLPSTLRIPDYIEGYPVTEISGYAFQSNNRISKLYIPDTIETIQDYAFAYCTQLYIVYLGRRTNWVRSGAFRGCTHLKYVYFNSDLDTQTRIQSSCFTSCTNLTDINLPDNTTLLQRNSFESATALTSIKIPKALTVIEQAMFANCASLKEVFIPLSIASVGVNTFTGCNSLTDVYYEGTEEDWNNINIESGNTALTNATIYYNQKLAVKQDIYDYHDDSKQNVFQKSGADLNNLTGIEVNKIYQCTSYYSPSDGVVVNYDVAFIGGHFYHYRGNKIYDGVNVENLSNYYNKSDTNTLLNNKQDKFANVEDLGGDLHLTPSQSAVYFDGRFRYTPDPNAEENTDDIVNRDILESYHDNTKADTTYVDNADNNLQEQIDAIASSSDVVDVVGTYAELQQYDTTHLKDNDIVKVLEDSTHNNAITYYRWDIDNQTWSYVGQSGPYYTKSETDALLQDKADEDDLLDHTRNHSNPHLVTKTQIGLGNVDNTSDLDKPISYATRTALNSKVNQVTAQWLHDNEDSLQYVDPVEILQCTTTGYNYRQGYCYVKKLDQTTWQPYWERIDVQPQTDLTNYYTKSEADDLLDTKQPLTNIENGEGDYSLQQKTDTENQPLALGKWSMAEGRGQYLEGQVVSLGTGTQIQVQATGDYNIGNIRKNAVLWVYNGTNGAYFYVTNTDRGTPTATLTLDATSRDIYNDVGDILRTFTITGNENFRCYMGAALASASHTEGNFNNTVWLHSDTELNEVNVSRQHAEGSRTLATGYAAHAEGEYTQALGTASHVEGYGNEASGEYTHVSGRENKAGYSNQTVVGQYNDNQSNSLFEVGNGTSNNNRSNAFRVTKSGTSVAQGLRVLNDYLTIGENSRLYLGKITAEDYTLNSQIIDQKTDAGVWTFSFNYPVSISETVKNGKLIVIPYTTTSGNVYATQIIFPRGNDVVGIKDSFWYRVCNGQYNTLDWGSWIKVSPNDYATLSQVQELISDYYTKTETDNKLAEKADIDGSYVEMSVGNAENLISDTKIDEKVPYNYRSAGGSKRVGNYLQEEIVGGTVVFNQLINKTKYYVSYTNNGVTITTNATDGTITISGTSTATGGFNLVPFATTATENIISTHKYVILGLGNFVNLTFVLGGMYTSNNTIKSATSNTNISSARITVPFGFSTSADIVIKPQIIDLTQMFGSTIADYIYSLETANTGDGVAYFKSLFPNDYYEYNTGTLISVKTSAHKIYNNNGDLVVSYPLDSDLELRGISKLDSNNNLYYDGDVYESDGTVTRNRKRYTVDGTESWQIGNSEYIKTDCCDVFFAPSDIKSVGTVRTNAICNRLVTLDSAIWTDNTAVNAICTNSNQIHFSISNSLLGINVIEYETYGDLEADGTIYSSSDWGIVKADSEHGGGRTLYLWINNAWQYQSNYYSVNQFFKTYLATQYNNNNPYIIEYELATPTNETATPYANPQYIDNNGYEEYTDTRAIAIPVGHNSQYSQDLRGKIENAPDNPQNDGDYIVRQTSGVNEYVNIGNIDDYVTNTDYATDSVAGVVKPSSSFGTRMLTGGILGIYSANQTAIDGKTDNYRPIVPANLDYAVASIVGHHVTLTQAQYDALATKDPNTYYYIIEE